MALRELRINDVAVFERCTLALERGFTVITGETGAGKSVCLGALRAVLGGRADPEVVRSGAAQATVAAVFDDVPDAVRTRLRNLGAPEEDLLTLTRVLAPRGRGASRIDGALVSGGALREIGDELVEVTAQGVSRRLVLRSAQRDLLDGAAGESAASVRNRLAVAVTAWREAARRLELARGAATTSGEELRRAEETVADLAPLALRPGEEGELVAERARLRSAGSIRAAADAMAEACGGEEGGAADRLAFAAERGRDLGTFDPSVHELTVAADDVVERLRELRLDALRVRDSVMVDDSRLEAVERRLDVLSRVRRSHGSIGAALEALAQAERTLAGSVDGPAHLAAAEQDAESARQRAGEEATALSRVRHDAARALERRATQLLHDLALPHARFRIVLGSSPDGEGVDVAGERLRCGLQGVDEVEFRLAVNRDAVPVPLDEGPSGGELSRLALALAAAAGAAGGPALVLDEVDTGIGGETAAMVGDVLATIARHRQVVAVTHRPEIAARARHHLLVTKRQLPGGPVASVVAVDGERRLHEIARLMSGRSTAAALRRAEELLREGSAGAGAAGSAVAERRS